MAENRRYYYLKLKENFYSSETMVILESMQDGLLYSNLLLKMYLMSLKSSGVLMLNDHLPHTPQTIATYTWHQVGTVERALKVFLEFGLVEILTDGAYYMADIQLLIGQSSTEGERKKRERTRLQRQKLLPSGRPILTGFPSIWRPLASGTPVMRPPSGAGPPKTSKWPRRRHETGITA